MSRRSRISGAPAAPAGTAPTAASASYRGWTRALEAEVEYVYQTLQRWGAGATEIEDLVQEVFVVLLRQRERYDRKRPLRPWIAGVAFKTLQEWRRRYWREMPRGFVDAADERPRPEQQLVTVQARALVLEALDQLPDKQRIVFVMHELDGMPMKDIARALSTPLFTLYSRLHKARLSFGRDLRRRISHDARKDWRSSPAVVLALAREPVTMPESVRQRAIARLRALRGEPPAPHLAPGWCLAAVACGLLAVLVVGRLPSTGPDAGRAAVASGPEAGPDAVAPARSARMRRAGSPVSMAPPALVRTRVAQPSPAALSRGLVGYWRFDEGPGSTSAHDLSSGGNDCALRRLDPEQAWETGALSGALSLGARGWLECPRVQSLQHIDEELTIAAWIAPGTAFSNYRALVALQKDAGRQDEFMFGFANGKLMFSSHSWRGKLMLDLPPALPRWFHVGVTRHADGTTILFVNAVELGRAMTRPGRLGRGGNPLIIGAATNGPDRKRTHARFDGQIDELLIYNRALSEADMQALAARRQPAAGS